MPEKVVQIPQVGLVTLKKNSRSKQIKLYVKPNKQVIVSLPYLASYNRAIKFAIKQTSWILKQQAKYNSGLTKFTTNSVYYTKSHLIKIVQIEIKNPTTRTNNEEVTILIPSEVKIEQQEMQEYIVSIITEVYRFEAKKYLPKRLIELASLHGFQYNRVTIRNNKSNWGSCSSQNNINLNLHLMKLPEYLIDYILLHELVHTKEKNHGAGFYAILDRVTGNKARELAKEVKQYSTYTF